MIEIPLFYKFHISEYFSFSDRILQTIIRHNLEELGLTTPVEKVQTSHDQLNDALTKTISKELTSEVVEADASRDDAFAGMKYYFQACQKSSITEWQDAANLLLTRVRHYGWTMNSASYNEQSTQTLNLLSDFETV